MINMPTEDDFQEIVTLLEGCEETWRDSLRTTSKELNLDPDLADSVVFMDLLENHIFCCEDCDHWKLVEERVYNEIAERKMCESCDENYL